MSQNCHKREILDYLDLYGVKKTAKKFCISERKLYRWSKERDKIIEKEEIRNKVIKYKKDHPTASIRQIKSKLHLSISIASIARYLQTSKNTSRSIIINIDEIDESEIQIKDLTEFINNSLIESTKKTVEKFKKDIQIHYKKIGYRRKPGHLLNS